MNPENFLDQEDIPPLIQALNHTFSSVAVATQRQALLESAGIDAAFIGNLDLAAHLNMFVTQLVAKFKTYRVSINRQYYHPLLQLLEHLEIAATYNLTDEDLDLFARLVERGKNNFQAIVARSTVGRIESPKDQGIGTGVLVGENLLLTCSHIFSKAQVQQAWVRFNYQAEKFPLDIDLFELDLNFIKHSPRQDFTLIKIAGKPKQSIVLPNNTPVEREQAIQLIHHPQGKHVEISEEGRVLQRGEDYLYHNLKTSEGSSGAPIFDRQWELIGIHRGNPSLGKGRPVIPGCMEGVPIHAFWEQQIQPLLT